jgi:hypothetical protein
MTGQAGIGEELLDWYLMHVKYMPYSSHDIVSSGSVSSSAPGRS